MKGIVVEIDQDQESGKGPRSAGKNEGTYQ